MVRYTACPVCGSGKLRPVFRVTDYAVSHEHFELGACSDCGLRFTQDAPGEADIQRYYQSDEYISHSDTNKGLINRLYHIARKRTLTSKRSLLSAETGLQKGTLLDIGAGTGAFVQYMQKTGWQVTGLEPDEQARKKALDLYQVHLLSLDKLYDQDENRYDVITLWHVLEHVHKLHQYLDQVKKMLKPAGRIFIAVPNYTSYEAGVYQNYWAAYDVPRHLYHFSPASMKQLLRIHDLVVHGIRPMWYDSFYISLLSEKYKTGKDHPIKGFLNGAVSNAKACFNIEKCSSLIYVAGKA
ncbi:MAG TPA: class I SAM-dependent methyltransferase [Puia sp.]|nr:class I SAM-dependent methyltransferase [Puia sp.]